jgi:hypothetical protein
MRNYDILLESTPGLAITPERLKRRHRLDLSISTVRRDWRDNLHCAMKYACSSLHWKWVI